MSCGEAGLEASGLGFGLGLWVGGGLGGDGAGMETDGGECDAADAVGQENSKSQRGEAGAN